MAKADHTFVVSIESTLHAALTRVFQDIASEQGVHVESIRVEWRAESLAAASVRNMTIQTVSFGGKQNE